MAVKCSALLGNRCRLLLLTMWFYFRNASTLYEEGRRYQRPSTGPI